jgi:ubiquinone/menaquinone biosynthesis C-methylase UbiE
VSEADGSGALGHYGRLAARYDLNWSYDATFLDWMTRQIVSTASITAADRIADVGGGTGLFARRILDQVHPTQPILCVDPSEPMLAQLPGVAGLSPILASAEQLAAGSTLAGEHLGAGDLDVILLKESVHHIPTSERATTLAGLARLLAPGGRLLVVMLPTKLDYPLFASALARFEELQPDPVDIEGFLAAAGLTARLTYEGFPLEIPKDRYLSMVRDRYMSLLSTFSDEQLAVGIAEIDRAYSEPVLRFDDRFAFVLGTRADAS